MAWKVLLMKNGLNINIKIISFFRKSNLEAINLLQNTNFKKKLKPYIKMDKKL